MAIKISNTTVIDNSRNITNIGIATVGSGNTGIVIDGNTGIITSISPLTNVVYYGDGSKLSGVTAAGSVSISTNTTNQAQYITYVTGTGTTTGFGVSTTGLTYNPFSRSLGISTSLTFGAQASISLISGAWRFASNTSANAFEFNSYIIGAVRENATRLKIDGTQGDVQILNTTNTTSSTTGALQVSGGVGIASDLYVNQKSYLMGSVGIGTTNPTTNLDVNGGVNISGVSTFGNHLIPFSSTVNIGGSLTRFGVGYWSDGSHSYGVNKTLVSGVSGLGLASFASYDAYLKSNSGGGSDGDVYIDTVVGGKVIAYGAGSVQIQHSQNTKLETLGTGVTVTGTTFTNQLNVSGIGTLSTARVTGAFRDSSDSPGTSGQVLQSTETGTQWTSATSLGFAVSTTSASYTLSSNDNGKIVSNSGNNAVWTVPTGLSTGFNATLFNNTATNQTFSVSGVTVYIAGSSVQVSGASSLDQRGLASIVCVSSNTFVISGAGLR